MSNNADQSVSEWKREDAELDRKIAQFEKEYKHAKPCKRYLETNYCVHLVNAQEKKFGKESKALIGRLIAISGQ